MTKPEAVRWRKSTRSNDQGECVEVAAFAAGVFGVRDSKNPGGPALFLNHEELRRLLIRVKNGR